MAALEKKISNTVSDIDRILAHKATEIDHNRAIQISAEFQENLDQLINSATRRRSDAFDLLERYAIGLGRAVEKTFDKIVDVEFQELGNESNAENETKIEDQSTIAAAPSIV
jgi:hemerythrin-like domain-containing protein